jgi:hypothetical protein
MTIELEVALDKQGEMQLPVGGGRGWSRVRICLGLLLVVAAAMKTHQLGTQPLLHGGLLDNRWLLMALVEGELALAIWLLSGVRPRASWTASVVCFSGFALVAVAKGLSGASSCGCFGAVAVNPWWILVLDVAVVAALLVFRPSAHAPLRSAHKEGGFWLFTCVGVTVGLVAASVIIAGPKKPVSVNGEFIGAGELVILEPQAWVGQPFPLLPYTNVRDQLARGKWFVVLYRHDCSHCMEMLPLYSRAVVNSRENGPGMSVALIQLPPLATESDSGEVAPANILKDHLPTDRDWFVATPAEIYLEEGVVMAAVESSSNETSLILNTVQ